MNGKNITLRGTSSYVMREVGMYWVYMAFVLLIAYMLASQLEIITIRSFFSKIERTEGIVLECHGRTGQRLYYTRYEYKDREGKNHKGDAMLNISRAAGQSINVSYVASSPSIHTTSKFLISKNGIETSDSSNPSPIFLFFTLSAWLGVAYLTYMLIQKYTFTAKVIHVLKYGSLVPATKDKSGSSITYQYQFEGVTYHHRPSRSVISGFDLAQEEDIVIHRDQPEKVVIYGILPPYLKDRIDEE